MENTNTADIIDAVVGLTPADALYATRHARKKVSDATQGSYDLFFAPSAKGLVIADRFLVAWYACLLSQAQDLAGHYRQALAAYPVDPRLEAAVQNDTVDALDASPLKAMLMFTRKLITKPVEGDEAAIKQLQAAGVSTPDIVTLAQLVAFLSYQIRLVAGLRAMKALESV